MGLFVPASFVYVYTLQYIHIKPERVLLSGRMTDWLLDTLFLPEAPSPTTVNFTDETLLS